ncbi:MAG: hypothetical protein ABR555_19070 [Pyrinomonadaceae bacterium]
MPAGIWGGQHINIDVGTDAATIQYDCATGRIDGPLKIDSKGRFNLKGSHSREHGGPVRMDEKANSRAALYSGTIKGNVMTLTVKLADDNEVLGTFALIRGRPGRIFRCM